MSLSIKASLEQKNQLVAQAKQVWKYLATELASRIPESFHRFAVKKGWNSDLPDGIWMLPEFLESLVKETKLGYFVCIEVHEDHRIEKDYGFTNSEDLQAKLGELKRAWEDVIRIEIDVPEEGFHTYVKFYATEFESKEDELAV